MRTLMVLLGASLAGCSGGSPDGSDAPAPVSQAGSGGSAAVGGSAATGGTGTSGADSGGQGGGGVPFETTPPPSTSMLQDCANGCADTLPLPTAGSGFVAMLGPDVSIKVSIAANLCARLTRSPMSSSAFHPEGSGITNSGLVKNCMVIDNRNAFGNAWLVDAGAPGVYNAWLQIETAESDGDPYCSLICPP